MQKNLKIVLIHSVIHFRRDFTDAKNAREIRMRDVFSIFFPNLFSNCDFVAKSGKKSAWNHIFGHFQSRILRVSHYTGCKCQIQSGILFLQKEKGLIKIATRATPPISHAQFSALLMITQFFPQSRSFSAPAKSHLQATHEHIVRYRCSQNLITAIESDKPTVICLHFISYLIYDLSYVKTNWSTHR